MKSAAAPSREKHNRSLLRPNARWRAILFGMGDLLFLVAVGIVTTGVMHGMHQFGWNFTLTCVAGMAAAMLVQMLMAFCIAPLLGSIESMIPSMVVGMISPMSVCTLHLIGYEPDHGVALVFGAIFGAVMFAFVEVYATLVKRSLQRMYPPESNEVEYERNLGTSGQTI